MTNLILTTQSPSDEKKWMGGKAGNLFHLSQNGLPIPPWFCVSAKLCQKYLSQIGSQLKAALSTLDYANQHAVDAVSAQIKELICALEITPEDRQLLARSTQSIGATRYAVRSSALAEDSAKDSFAGQLDTYLYVAAEDVETKIKECWASGFGPRSLTYMANRGIDAANSHVAVVVQAMVDSDVSGVMFMANPTGNLDETVIVAGYGLGEGIVSDQVESDMYIFDQVEQQWHLQINTKLSQIIRNPDTGCGTIHTAIATSLHDAPALNEDQRLSLRELGLRISSIYDHFQDIEWALAGDTLYITQSRPITTIPRGQRSVFDNSNVVESYPGITKPLTYSHVRYGYENLFRNAIIRIGIPEKLVYSNHQIFRNLVGYLNGRIYYNLGNWYRMFALVPGTKSKLGVWEEMLGIDKGLRDTKRVVVSRLVALRVAINSLRYFALLTPLSTALKTRFTKIYNHFRSLNLSQKNNHQLIELYQTKVSKMLRGWEITLYNDAYAFGFSALVRTYLKKYGLCESLFGELMAGEENLESVMPVRSIVRISELARQSNEIAAWISTQLDSSSPSVDFETLANSPTATDFKNRLQKHIELFGDRCVEELKLESIPFRDDPKKLLELVQGYSQSDLSVREMVAKERQIRQKATGSVARKLSSSPLKKIWFTWILNMARRSVRYRESSRLDRARSFAVARDIFNQIGANLTHEGAIESPTDIFYLSVDEVLGFISGSSINCNLKWLINQRRADEERYKTDQLADRIKTQGTAYLNTFPPRYPPHLRPSSDDGSLRGIGCSTGVITAEAVVVDDPKNVQDIHGKILVSQMTDPGWVFLMISAAGLIVEKGSLLSHTAIIGRELGVPTVVGVCGATRAIQTGDTITVNGQTGSVTIDQKANDTST